MIAIILVSAVLFLLTFVTGKFFLLKTGNVSGLYLTDIIFVGTVLVNTFMNIYSLFLPTDILPVCILGIIGILLLIYLKLKQDFLKPGLEIRTFIFLIPFALLVCLFAADGPKNADSISYHIPAISWIEKYAVVPGLGNMHGRLAFNPNIFNLMAGFSFSEVAGQSLYAVNSFFSIAFFYYLLQFFRNRSKYALGVQLFFMIAGMLSIQFMVHRLSSPHPDLAAGLLTLYLFLRYAEFNLSDGDQHPEQRRSFFFMLSIIAVYIITIKLSSLFIVLLPFLAAWKYRTIITFRQLALIVITGLIIVIPWLTRNYYLSGYLVYPVNALDVFNPDWKIPGWAVDCEKMIVFSWAKWSTAVELDKVAQMRLIEWLPVWFLNLSVFWKIFLPFCLISPLTITFMYFSHKTLPWAVETLKLWAVCYIGVVFWFCTAPDPRFGYPFILVATLAFLLLLGFGIPLKKSISGRVAAATGILFLLVCYLSPLRVVLQISSNLPFMLVKPLPPDFYTLKGLNAEIAAADQYDPEKVRIDPIIYPRVHAIGQKPSFSPVFIEEGDLLVNSTVLFRGESVQEGFKMASP